MRTLVPAQSSVEELLSIACLIIIGDKILLHIFEINSMEAGSRSYSYTFLDEISLEEGDMDEWVDGTLSGSQDFVQELLEIGEDSLEFSAAEDELRKLQMRLNDAESRESRLKQDLNEKKQRITDLEDGIDQLKKELMEERERAKDEAEDMAQETAELRYQLTEMLEEERQLRARTEQVSVHRVEELESQVRQARHEAVAALARCRKAESQAEKEIQELRLALEEAQQQLQEAKEVESVKQECQQCTLLAQETAALKEELSSMEAQLSIKVKEKEGEVLALRSKLEQANSLVPENTSNEETVSNTEVRSASMEPKSEDVVNHIAGDPDSVCIESIVKNLSSRLGSSEVGVDVLLRAEKVQEILTAEMQQEDRFKHALRVLTEQHSEALKKHKEERELMEAEVESTRSSLSAEIRQLQQVIDDKSHELELAHRDFAVCRSSLEKESVLVEELSGRIEAFEVELESERASHSDSALKCTELNNSLDEAIQKLSTVEAELELSKNENETLRKVIESSDSQLSDSIRERHILQENLQQLRGLLQNQEQRLNRQQQDLLSQRGANSQLARRIGELNSEVLILQQRLITCQTQVSEMAMKNVILDDTIVAKKKKIKESEETISQQAVKLGKQEEKYFSLQAKFSALQNDFSALEAKLSETRKREQEGRIHIERLSLELTMAKQEVVNSEVRLQKAVKHAKEQLDAERYKHQESLNKQKQTEWFLNRKLEQLERTELEKEQSQQELRRLKSAGQ